MKGAGTDEAIKWFDQGVETGEVQKTGEPEEELDLIKAQQQLKAASTTLRSYDAGLDTKEFHEKVVSLFPKEEQEGLTKALALERQRRKELAHSVQVNLEPSPLAAPIARELNKYLQQAADDAKTFQGKKELWKWYLRATRNIMGIHPNIPPAAWNVLWRTQVNDEESPEIRTDRVLELVEGLSKAGIPLSSDQKDAKLQALAANGKEKQALMEWEEEFNATEGKNEDNLRQGIKLFATTGDIRNGVQMLQKYQELFPSGEPRIVHPLIAICAQTNNDVIAYSLYLSLRDRLKTDMAQADYDYVGARFLAQDKADLALAVFRDMMIQGNQAVKSGRLTTEEESKMKEGMMYRIETMHSRARKTSEVNKISFEALTHLPKQWQNRFFFGKWIKKLIGMGELEDAEKVIELMFQRGIVPDTSHVNGVVGGLLRSEIPERQKRGEVLAWNMIHKRIEMVTERNDRGGETETTRKDLEADVERLLADATREAMGESEEVLHIPRDPSRRVPRANMETFNILGLSYLYTQNWSYLALLETMLGPAKLEMGPFFMNHLLYMNLYTQGRDAMWNKFLDCTQTTLPDIDTFDCLWQAQQERKILRLDESITREPDEWQPLPSPRAMFDIMVAWFAALNDRKRAAAVQGFGEELYARIMASFCDKNDFPGVIVLLNGILAMYKAAPSESIKEIVVVGLANLLEADTPTLHIGRRARVQMAAKREGARTMGRARGGIRRARNERAEHEGRAVTDLGLEEVNLLSELVRTVLIRVHRDADKVEGAIAEAKAEMGLREIATGDIDAYEVEGHML